MDTTQTSIGARLIAEERQRQVEVEGWTPEHDDEHANYELTQAALCYANNAIRNRRGWPQLMDLPLVHWPWDADWFKPGPDSVRTLVKAGALIAAEIDRLQRAAP